MFYSSFQLIYLIFIFLKCDFCFGDNSDESVSSPGAVSPVKYIFYNRDKINDPDIVLTSMVTSFPHFDSELPTKLIIHGYNSDCNEQFAIANKDALLKYTNANVICVDWSSMSNNGILNTIQGIQSTKDSVAILVENLNIDIAKLHLIGHSFGAHIAGLVSRKLQLNGLEKVGHITGLDPAAIFMNYEGFQRLNKESADLVEVLHTSSIGTQYPNGHFDFFINGGILQPGCVEQIACCHSRSHQLYAESLTNPWAFPAMSCLNLQTLTNRSCTTYNGIFMGNLESYSRDRPKKEGIYYVKTKAVSPFSALKINDDPDLLQHPRSTSPFVESVRLFIFGLHLYLEKMLAIF